MNILQTIFWVIILNALRIAVVIMVEEWTDFSIATGLAHDVAGLVAFFVIFGFVLSTNCLLISMFPGPEKEEEIETYIDSNSKQPEIAAPTVPRPSIVYEPARWQKTCWTYGSILFAFVAVVSIRPRLYTIESARLTSMQEPERGQFPNELMGWTVTDFEHIRRGENDIQGGESFVWTLTKDSRTVRLSIDGSFDDFHDLQVCYIATGWLVKQTRSYGWNVAPRGSEEETSNEYCSLDVWRKTGEKGHVYFGAVDRTGGTVLPPTAIPRSISTFVSRASQRVGWAFSLRPKYQGRDGFEVPISTIQIIYMPNADMSEAELLEVKELYLQARTILRQIPRFRRT